MRRAVFLLALVLTPASADAQTWIYAASGHFEVYSTGGEGQARDALTYFERVHAFLTGFLNVSPKRSVPTRLIVFTSDRQFAPYRPNQVAEAFFLSAQDRDYIVMRALDPEGAHTIVNHEYAHLIFRHAGVRYPLWLSEGLAEFFSTMAPEGDKMGVGRPPEDRLRYLNEAAMLPLERLFSVTTGSAEYNTRAHAGVFYSQSWALTHMLLADERYRAQSGKLLQMVSTGVPSATAFTQVYARTLDAVAVDLRNYIRQSRYTYYRASYTAPPSLGQVAMRRVDAFEADLVTANLLAAMIGREADARAALERLAGQKPDDPTVLETLAYFELRRGRRDAALQYFSRAVGANSRMAPLYRDYASLEPSRAEELLPKAIALDPHDLQSRLAYANLLLTKRMSKDAETVLTAATDISPELRYRYYRLLAGTYMDLDRLDEARTAAAQAQKYARPGAEAQSIAALVKALEEYALQRTLGTVKPQPK